VFIAYSRVDGEYVEKLAAYLADDAIPVWYDRQIATGERWTDTLKRQIETCAAVIVVMTPRSEASEWVATEIRHARDCGKPILPLRLDGPVFFTLNGVHYTDVTGAAMPGPPFLHRIRELTGADAPHGTDPGGIARGDASRTEPADPPAGPVPDPAGSRRRPAGPPPPPPAALPTRTVTRAPTKSDDQWVRDLLTIRTDVAHLAVSAAFVAAMLRDIQRFPFGDHTRAALIALGGGIDVMWRQRGALGFSQSGARPADSAAEFIQHTGLPVDPAITEEAARQTDATLAAIRAFSTDRGLESGWVKDRKGREKDPSSLTYKDTHGADGYYARVAQALHAARRASAACRDLRSDVYDITVDVSGLDLTRVEPDGPRSFEGFLWNDRTVWPEAVRDDVAALSASIGDGAFIVARR
jgi:hypothetical protein